MLAEYVDMRCLILGGAGFLGKHLTRYLTTLGHEVRVYDLNISSIKRDGVEFFQGDFCKYTQTLI